MINQESNIIKIGKGVLCGALIEFFVMITICCIFTIGYVQLPDTLKSNKISICYLAYTICTWNSLLLKLLKLKIFIKIMAKR